MGNKGGAWVGSYRGVYNSEDGDTITWWYTGAGGYAGLSFYMWIDSPAATAWVTHGMIFPGKPPPEPR